MKIWLMNHYATSMYRDKAGRHYWFAKKLEKESHSVTVFCATTFLNNTENIDTGKSKYVIEESDGTPFVFIKTSSYKGNGTDRVKNMVTFFLNLIPSAKKIAKKYGKPDVIIASSVHPLTMVAGILLARKLKCPCVCEIRDLWPEAIFSFGKSSETSFLGRILVCGEHWIYKNADALIFTKEGDTDYLKEKGWITAQGGDISLDKCHYINNGVDLETYSAQITTDILDDPDLLDGTNFNVVYAGTVRPVNNVGNLLDCAAILKKKPGYENVQFLIFGDGSELDTLRKRVEDEHLDNVKLKGFVARKYMPYILNKSSINILNYSQNEYNWTRGNSSNKLFEYMASGKPIISTVKMGYSIINKYNCGIELDACTPECLSEAIMHFCDMKEDEYNRFGINAYEGAKDFDFNVLTKKLLAVIGEVTDK